MRRFGISLFAVLLASQVAADSLGGGGGIPVSAVVISGTPTGGQCAQWVNSTTLQSSGAACATGGGSVTITGTPAANQLTDWSGTSSIQAITTGTGVVTALGVNTNTNGGFLTMTGAPGTGIQTGLTVNTNANGGFGLVNGTPTATDCLQWSSTGSQDSGGPCSPSGQISGRLTLTTGVPRMIANVSGGTLVYFTPYNGNTIPIWNATLSKFVWITFSEVSQATTDTTLSPAAVTTNSNYDVFCWNPAALHCTRGPAWTSATARGTGVGTTQLATVQGIDVNANAITNGPAANQGTYVGSFRSNGSSTVDFTFAGPGTTGVAGVVSVWNRYNRVNIRMASTDFGAGYTYTPNTIRQARASAGNQVSFLSGLQSDGVSVTFMESITATAAIGSFGRAGVAMDSTTTFDQWDLVQNNTTTGVLAARATGTMDYDAQLGWHTISRNESSDSINAQTFDANSADNMTASLMY